LTEDTIAGCKKSGVDTVIVVIEQQTDVEYSCTTVHPDEEFNYNAYLNIGARSLNYIYNLQYLAFLNNDLVMHKGWGFSLIQEMERQRCGSGSPKCPMRHKELNKTFISHRVGLAFCGWAFVLSKEVYDLIGGLNEQFVYWCSDNIVAHQLKEKGVNHLITNKSTVRHISNQSGQHLEKEVLIDYTWKQAKKFKEITGVELFPDELIEKQLKQ